MLAQYIKHSMGQKNISNGWTVLNVGGQGLIMKNGQADLRHHEQVTIVPKRTYGLKKTDGLP